MNQQDDQELQTVHVPVPVVEDAEQDSLTDNEDEAPPDNRVPEEPFSLSRRLLQMLALNTLASKAQNS